MKKNSNFIPIAIMFCLFAIIAFVTGLQNPFGVIAKNQFEVSNFMAQLGNFANFIAYAFMGIPAGILISKMGYRKTAIVAVIVGFVGVCVMYASGLCESFPIYIVGAFIAGFSMCMLNAVVNPLLNTLGGGGKKGNQLIQLGGSCNSISATIVPIFAGYLIGDIENAEIANTTPALIVAMAIFVVAGIVLALYNFPEPAQEQVVADDDKRSPLAFNHFRLGIIAIFVYVGVEVAIPSIANLYMTEPIADGGLDISTELAGIVCGTYWFLMFIGRLIGGIIGGKVEPRIMLSTVLSIAAIFIILAIYMPSDIIVNMPVFEEGFKFGMEEMPLSVMFLVLCGLCTSVMWGGIFNLAVEGLGNKTALASGIFMTMVCGGGFIAPIQGWIAEHVGYLNSYWLIFAGIIYMLYFALRGSRIREK